MGARRMLSAALRTYAIKRSTDTKRRTFIPEYRPPGGDHETNIPPYKVKRTCTCLSMPRKLNAGESLKAVPAAYYLE